MGAHLGHVEQPERMRVHVQALGWRGARRCGDVARQAVAGDRRRVERLGSMPEQCLERGPLEPAIGLVGVEIGRRHQREQRLGGREVEAQAKRA
jgi:hypothetical protein